MMKRRTKVLSNNKKLIAVIGATGQQGGGVLRALQARGQFKVRALTRNPDKHRELAEEVVEADVNKPETLKAAFEGAQVRLAARPSIHAEDVSPPLWRLRSGVASRVFAEKSIQSALVSSAGGVLGLLPRRIVTRRQ